MGEISGVAISGLRKKLADSTSANPKKKKKKKNSANPLVLDSILTNLHLKYSNSYICIGGRLNS